MRSPLLVAGVALPLVLIAACSEPEQERAGETAENYAERIENRAEGRSGPPPAAIPQSEPGPALAGSGLDFYPGKVVQLNTVPSGFTGTWDFEDGDCSRSSELRFTIDRDGATFYESTGEASTIRQVAPNSVIVTLQMTGEGESWTEETRLTLDPGGRTLTRTDPSGGSYEELKYRRCPQG